MGEGTVAPPPYSCAPVHYTTGELYLAATDLSSSGYGKPWGHTRSFASRMTVIETHGNGFNWKVSEWPYLVIGLCGEVTVQGRPNEAVCFDKVEDAYVPRFNVKQTLTLDTVARVYRLRELDGTVTEFDQTKGHFRRQIDPAGNVIEVTGFHSNNYNPIQVERRYTSGGTTTTEQLFYEYEELTGDQVLTQVTLRRRVGAGEWANVARASYTYYNYGDLFGSDGDLKTVATASWNGSAWVDTGTTLYRYYCYAPASESSSSSSSGGLPPSPGHQLKYVVNPASYARLAADPEVPDPLTASDGKVALYADHYFEYDAESRVTREDVHGGDYTYTFQYAQSAFADGYNAWKYKTTETQPSGAVNVVYSNFAGQPMLRAFTSGENEWCEFTAYNDDAQVVLRAAPSAISGYDEQYADLLHEVDGNYEYLKDSDGLVHVFQYHEPTRWLACKMVQHGELGAPIKLREYHYCACYAGWGCCGSSSSSSAGDPLTWFLAQETVYPSETDQAEQIITSYCYTFHPGTCKVLEKTTTLPAVPSEQNGSGTSATRREVFDTYGNLVWTMDERGILTRNSYDIPSGALVQQIQDVDTSRVSDAPEGWSTPSGGGLHLVTDYEHDSLGRIAQVLGPEHESPLPSEEGQGEGGTATTVRRATWFVYQEGDVEDETRTAQGYATGSSPNYTYTLVNPVSITRSDKKGHILQEIRAVRSSTSGRLQASDAFGQSSYVAWTTNQYGDCCSPSATRRYHTIPSSGAGSSGTNYDETQFGYDSAGRRNRQVTPGGTITATVFDARGLVIGVYVGTNDAGAAESDPTGNGAEGNNMVLVTESQYDDGQSGGDGNLTRQTNHVDSSTTRVTDFTYDWRNRKTATDGEEDFFEKLYHDNLDRVVKTERYDTTATGNLASRAETLYDDRGRLYRTRQYAVDPETGQVGNCLESNVWFDAAGQNIKQQPAGSKLITKTVYDGVRRPVRDYRGFDLDETGYSDADSIDDDTIMEQTERTYDAAGNLIKTELRQRYHNATGTGPLTGPAGSEPKSRNTYTAAWHDPIGRQIATADYGTFGGQMLTRPDVIPSRTDTILVTSTEYDTAGNVATTTNPGGVVTRFAYDAAGRVVEQILNYRAAGSSSSSAAGGDDCPASDDTNVTILTAYNADGNVSAITAVNAATGNQTTQYVYGTTLADSAVAMSTLKGAEIYPDSSDENDRITFKYNRQGEVTEVTDQAGTVHAFDYDKLGRKTQDRVTALGTGVDDAIRRIATTYEVRGMVEKITSYDDPSVGSGGIDNEALFTYNAFGQLVAEYQEHGGAVNTSTTPVVGYGYADGSENTVRPTSLSYPNGRVLSYGYGSFGGINDALSRIASLIDNDGTTHLADYSYLGLGSSVLPSLNLPMGAGRGAGAFVEVDYTQPDIKYTLVGTSGGNDPDTGDIYRGLDRFGRIKDCYWYNYGTSADVDRIQYGYDRNGSRIYRRNLVAPNGAFDELYAYDQIDRLKTMERGPLNQERTTVTDLEFAQCWGLDATGNWRDFREDADGEGWSLIQTRDHNPVNEMTDVHETLGAAWITPLYDRAGNMTRVPKPADPTEYFTCTYDPWNRLVRVQEGGNTIAEYGYDGAKRRILKKTYTAGQLSETRHFYHTEPSKWQVLEERVQIPNPESLIPASQFVWGLRYIDDLILRDRDTNAEGTLDERLYALQDANWNVTSIAGTDGAAVERFAYSAYGVPTALTGAFGSRSASIYAWETRFGGYLWDMEICAALVRHRVLVPSLGWIQRDSVPPMGHRNLYEYVQGRPTGLLDPSGCIVIADDITIVVIGGLAIVLLAIGLYMIYDTRTGEACARCAGRAFDSLSDAVNAVLGWLAAGAAACQASQATCACCCVNADGFLQYYGEWSILECTAGAPGGPGPCACYADSACSEMIGPNN